MNVSELMTRAVKSCGQGDDLQRAAQIMWESDCGAVPVVDAEQRVVGIVTDRDICMAAYTQGMPLWRIPVTTAMSRQVHAVRESDLIDEAEATMRQARVHRVPVLDGGDRLKGILSMNDLARHAHRTGGRKGDGLSGDRIVQTLAAICEPYATTSSAEPTAKKGARPAA
jgi:CBS domain-containing protein